MKYKIIEDGISVDSLRQSIHEILDHAIKEEIDATLLSGEDIKAYFMEVMKTQRSTNRLKHVVNTYFPQFKDILDKLLILK